MMFMMFFNDTKHFSEAFLNMNCHFNLNWSLIWVLFMYAYTISYIETELAYLFIETV